MADWTIKQHDTYPPLGPVTLGDSLGVINLTTAAAVRLRMKTSTGTAWPGVGECDILDAAGGIVQYDWDSGDTATVNTYSAEFEIEWATGDLQTVPNDSYFEVEIKADLG